jgi:hypothetical protein
MKNAVTVIAVRSEQWFAVMQHYRSASKEHYSYRFDPWIQETYGIVSYQWIQPGTDRSRPQGYYQTGFQTVDSALMFMLKY